VSLPWRLVDERSALQRPCHHRPHPVALLLRRHPLEHAPLRLALAHPCNRHPPPTNEHLNVGSALAAVQALCLLD
jgi:hypothetical protein